jgi:nitroreductase
VRHLRPDPVDAATVDRLLWAATRASSPNNTQHWHFVVLTDPGRRAALAAALRPFLRWIDTLPPPGDASETRTRTGARHLLESLADVPVVVAVCADHAYPPPPARPDARYLWSTVGTATQNLLVAARAHGLGAVPTMFHVADEPAVAEVLGLPDGVRVGCLVPIGHPAPARPFGPVRRRPLAEVVHRERW